MGSGRAARTTLTSAVLVLFASAPTTRACLWCIQIDESPAPPPDKVPPFSAGATRDLALLPYQIIGVLGAYLAAALIIGLLLLTVGRSMRRRAQEQPDAAQQEMIKPSYKAFDPSPISPGSNRGWNRLRGKRSAAGSVLSVGSGASPELRSAASFDPSVLEADRARMQSEMERLYAAVAEQDGSKKGIVIPEILPAPPEPPAYASPTEQNPYIQRLHPADAVLNTPRSPVRAIYPSEKAFFEATAPPQSPYTKQYAPDRQPSLASSKSMQSTSSSGGKKLRKSLRSLTISPPMQRRMPDNDDGFRTPLSPHAYVDPGSPPEPPTASFPNTPAIPETPATERMFPHYASDDDEGEEENIDQVRDLPLASPQRAVHPSRPSIVTNFSKPVPQSPVMQQPAQQLNPSRSMGMLPLREMNRHYAAQQQNQLYSRAQQQAQGGVAFDSSAMRSPGTAGATGVGGGYLSAGPVKTTFVEARARGAAGGPSNYLAATPRTGLPTPYSPYMPFTPMTPVTPHLTSRAERKQRAREERSAMAALTEEDAVAGDADLWDSGY